MNDNDCPEDWAAYTEGEMTVNRNRELEAHLAGCERCRRVLEHHRHIAALLQRTDDDLENVDLAPSLLEKVRSAPMPKAAGHGWRPAAVMAALAFAATAGVLLWCVFSGTSPLPVQQSRQVREKAVRGGMPESDRWVAILPHRLLDDGRTRRLGECMSSRDALLVAYTNLGPRPYEYLMVFAVDAQGTVHWLHPAYPDDGGNPSSLEIRQGVSSVEIPEAVWHDFSPGTLRVIGLFSHRPHRVEEIERMVGALWDDGVWWEATRLPLEDTGQHIVTTEVNP